MVYLSVNVNKIATLRNARGQNKPHLLEAVKAILSYGADGITVHPRPDGRHIRFQDVLDIARLFNNQDSLTKNAQFNIEGYPSASFLDLIEETRPHQCTLVPDPPDVLTSNAGWNLKQQFSLLEKVIKKLKTYKVRASLFIDPFRFSEEEESLLVKLDPQRVELYTEQYARNYPGSNRKSIMYSYKTVAKRVAQTGNIAINAGHDLDQKNLGYLLKNIPEIREVSIGHALISEALYDGLKDTVQSYLKICHK